MTPLPKRRLSTRRQTQREKGLKLIMKSHGKCSHCGGLCIPHHICKHCGYYGEKLIKEIKTKIKKKE